MTPKAGLAEKRGAPHGGERATREQGEWIGPPVAPRAPVGRSHREGWIWSSWPFRTGRTANVIIPCPASGYVDETGKEECDESRALGMAPKCGAIFVIPAKNRINTCGSALRKVT
jgi:hypothetical protein